MKKSGFADLYKKMEVSPKYQAEKLSVGFISEVHKYMQENSITKAEIARRADVSPAYVTKLFNGSANLSLETMAKLALALDCQIHLHLACKDARVRWFDVHQIRNKTCWAEEEHRGKFVKVFKSPSAVNQNDWNDEKFALAA